MKLIDLLKMVSADAETEVFDSEVDTYCAYYCYGNDFVFGSDEDETNLLKLEKWFRDLEITKVNKGTAYVNAYAVLRADWESLRTKLIEMKYRFVEGEQDESYLDEECADYVNDIYTTLSQGYYGFARDFVKLMNL